GRGTRRHQRPTAPNPSDLHTFSRRIMGSHRLFAMSAGRDGSWGQGIPDSPRVGGDRGHGPDKLPTRPPAVPGSLGPEQFGNPCAGEGRPRGRPAGSRALTARRGNNVIAVIS